MKKGIVLFLCMLMLLSIVISSAEELPCRCCENSTSCDSCNCCCAATSTGEWNCLKCGNVATGNFCSNCGSSRPTMSSDDPIIVDFQSEVDLENALNCGDITIGKVVRFKVNSVHPDSAFGFNLWSGNHLNFITAIPVDVQAGGVIVARITKVVSTMGSWLLSYDALEITPAEGSYEK